MKPLTTLSLTFALTLILGAQTSAQFPQIKTPKVKVTTPKVKVPSVEKNLTNQINRNVPVFTPRHLNFVAVPSATIAGLTFNQDYRISAAVNWRGPQYEVYRAYRPQWHDSTWYNTNYNKNVVLIGGGWYYWNAGYWYPAWGYDPGAAYYPYDGPIYTGETRRPFDEVVADVQASLQEQGYYHGEVDGLMGPLTRTALADFQRDHGLITTAALDQPTLASLGLG